MRQGTPVPVETSQPEFVPQPIPGFFEGLGNFARTVAADPVGGLRFSGRALLMTAAVLICVPPHYLWRALGRPSPWSRLLLMAMARFSGMRVRHTGTPRRDHVLYVGNHLSWLDIPALGGITGTAFVAQDRIADWPVFGWLARLNNTVFVSRTDKLAVGQQIDDLRHAIARHRVLALFPEGTTTDGRSLLPFKAPLFAALDPPPPEMLIQPIVMDFDDTGKSLAWIGVETAPANGWRVLKRKGTFHVTVHFLEPFDPATIGHRKAVSAECRRRIAARLSETLGGAEVS
jgi:1-acyl-sn-glycerol-3-phosphate acyltransferase